MSKYCMSSSIIDGNKNDLSPIDNKSKAQILKKSFEQEHTQRFITFKKYDAVKLIYDNSIKLKIFKKTSIITLRIKHHYKKVFSIRSKWKFGL